MTMPTPPDVPSWTVTAQTQATQVAADGTPVEGVRVSYRTGKGVVSSVFIPQAAYSNIDNVRAIIGEAAAHSDAVQSLSSGA